MKINLLFKNNQSVELDLEKIREKIGNFNNLLKKSRTQQVDVFSQLNLDSETLDKKSTIHHIFSLINDLKCDINFREIYNIINKNNPNDKVEESIVHLFEGLSTLVKKKKIIHQNNIFMLYRIINQNDNQSFNISPLRTTNLDQSQDNPHLKIVDYNNVPLFFDQLINFINAKNDFEPWINMQIVHIHNLAISPFANNNILFSKILSIWYWLTYASSTNDVNFPIQTYLEVLKLNSDQYLSVVKKCLKEGDYTDFIDFIIENITHYQQKKNITTQINQFLHKNQRIYLAQYEEQFLFVIIYYNMHEFDWKFFKKTTKWNSSKQYIIRNLSKFVNYSLLTSKNFKNRKFFYQSRWLRKAVDQLIS